jgi:DNA-binding IclR family transcriptional regulator
MARGTLGRRPRAESAAKPRIANATADRAVDTLLAFTEERPIWSTLELAEHFGMPRSTMYRYLSTLRGVGLIAEDQAGRYRLGPRILQLARVAKQQQSILRIAAPVIAQLNRRFNETVILNERIGHEMIMLERIDTRHNVAASSLRGQLLPWPAAASAKVMLAFAAPAEQQAILRLMKPVQYTPKTITSRLALKAALAKIEEQGYAVGDEELEPGVRGIAVPIFVVGECRFSLSIAVPSFRLPDDKLPEMIEALKASALAISKGMTDL